MAKEYQIRFIEATDPLFEQAADLRYGVLFEPHGVSRNLDLDDRALGVLHVVALDMDKVVGYGRVERRGIHAQIAHLCVDPAVQGGGIGSQILQTILDRLRKEGTRDVFLNARFTAMGLYRRFGFVEVGGVFDAENFPFPHKRMELKL